MPGNFLGQRIRDQRTRSFLVLDPCRMGQSHPDRTPVDQKLDIDSIGMASSNGHDQALIQAMNRFFGPAVSGGEVRKHGLPKLYRPAGISCKRRGKSQPAPAAAALSDASLRVMRKYRGTIKRAI